MKLTLTTNPLSAEITSMDVYFILKTENLNLRDVQWARESPDTTSDSFDIHPGML